MGPWEGRREGGFSLLEPPSEEESSRIVRKTKREPRTVVLRGRRRMGEGEERKERTERRGHLRICERKRRVGEIGCFGVKEEKEEEVKRKGEE